MSEQITRTTIEHKIAERVSEYLDNTNQSISNKTALDLGESVYSVLQRDGLLKSPDLLAACKSALPLLPTNSIARDRVVDAIADAEKE